MGGGDAVRRAPLRITHADGTLSTRLVVEDISSEDIGSEGVTTGRHVVVGCRDQVVDLRVEHHLRTHPDSGVLEQWVEVVHGEDGPVRLAEYDSVAPFLLVTADATVTHFGGSGWADEWRWSTDPLVIATTSLDSLGGVQPHLQRSPVALVEPGGPATETSGTVLAVSVAWGGNTRIDLDVRPRPDPDVRRELRLRAGANPLGAEYVLDPGVRFVGPTVAWTWSETGRDAVTRSFHDWTRARALRDPERLRPIVVNNWESTFFDFDESRVLGLIDRTAELGADLFLLDDGWFGTTYPRDDDSAGLGDWQPDRRKLPDGLAPLARHAAALDVRFGIWVEPEMVNPSSELYGRHPDWVVADRRERLEYRNQLVLDPLRPEVRRFEQAVVADTLAADPHISFVKWDANRPITDAGSPTLAADRQSNVWIDHVRATWDVMEQVADAHPGIELMLCASGGGRTDHGTLRFFHEFWTSDNTDPVARVRMQWACSHLFPAAAMAAHVTRWGERPLQFACAVALSGRFGFDLDLDSLDEEGLAVCRRAVALARRTQDLVQQGRLVRLVSPVDGDHRDRAALAHVAADGARAVVFAYQLPGDVDGDPPRRASVGPGGASADPWSGPEAQLCAAWHRPDRRARRRGARRRSAARRARLGLAAPLALHGADLGADRTMTHQERQGHGVTSSQPGLLVR